jgi:hypothetical protein
MRAQDNSTSQLTLIPRILPVIRGLDIRCAVGEEAASPVLQASQFRGSMGSQETPVPVTPRKARSSNMNFTAYSDGDRAELASSI